MHKTLMAALAALSLLSGTASAAYAGEGTNLAATETPAIGVGISAGPALMATGSEAYQTSAKLVLERSNVGLRDAGSEQYQDIAGIGVQSGNATKSAVARL